jgi:hypothetical protein
MFILLLLFLQAEDFNMAILILVLKSRTLTQAVTSILLVV